MTTIDGPVRTIALRDHREAPVVFERGPRYHFMWSIADARSPDYRVGWGTASSALGPVVSLDDGFIVLQRHGAAVGTACPSVVNVPSTDRWYAAYHRHALPLGGGHQRQTMLSRLQFIPRWRDQPDGPAGRPLQARRPGRTRHQPAARDDAGRGRRHPHLPALHACDRIGRRAAARQGAARGGGAAMRERRQAAARRTTCRRPATVRANARL